MKIFTSHLREARQPVLVKEGFSWAAFFFGWLFLLFNRAWIAAVLLFVASVILALLGRRLGTSVPMSALYLAQGLFARDMVRWNLSRSGYRAGPVVAAADYDSALGRLFAERAELFAGTPLMAGVGGATL